MGGQERVIELLLAGDGEHPSMGVSVRIPDEGLSLGRTCNLEMTLIHDDEHIPSDLNVVGKKGLSTPSELISPDGGAAAGDGRTVYRIPVVPAGRPGESSLKVLVRGGRFGATLGISEQVITVRPVEVDISLLDQPYRWDGSGGIPIHIRIDVPEEEKLKGTMSISLTDTFGRRIDLASGGERKIKLKGPSDIVHNITPVPGIVEDKIDLHIDLQWKTGKLARTFEGAIFPPASDDLKIAIPATAVSGESIRVWVPVRVDEKEEGAVTLHLEGGNQPVVLVPDETDRDDEAAEFVFPLPGGMKGEFLLKLMIEGSETASGSISIIERPPIVINDIRCRPRRASRGSEVRFNLSYDPEDAMIGEIRAEVIIGGRKGASFSIPLDPSGNSAEHEFTVSGSMPLRDNPCEVSVFRGDERICREVRSKVLEIAEESTIKVDLATPLDLEKRAASPHSDYLMPGENTIGSDRILDLEIITTSTGRRLLVYLDRIVWGEDWSGSRDIDVRDRYLLHMFASMIMERFFSNSVERYGRLLGMSASWGATEFAEDTSFDLSDYLKRAENGISWPRLKELPRFTAYVIDYLSNGTSVGPAGPKKKKRDLSSALHMLLDGGILEDGSADPSSRLKETVEGIVKDMKGGDREYPGRIGLVVIGALLKRLFGSLNVLLKTKKRESLDMDGWREHVHEVIFDLIALALVKAEIISTWSDPAVFSWDELRVLRQRSLKREVTTALDLVDLYGRVFDSTRERMTSLKRNMELRRTMKVLASLRTQGTCTLGGMAGEVWRGKLRLRAGGSSSDAAVKGSLFLPPGGWQLISPRGSGDDSIRDIGGISLPESGDLGFDIEIRSPRDFNGEAKALLYLYPASMILEGEP
ncbi:MAG: hypothetical protein ACMUIG_06110 [Thermoplasmatota archaeon]